MTQLREMQSVTLAEFEAIKKQEGLTYELIDGVVMMSPRPGAKHQKISGKTYAKLLQILEDKNCEPILEIDLVLEQQNFVPDLMIICDENVDDMVRCEKPPLIIIEIVSPSSASRDHIIKREAYEKLGVQEYWIISPGERCITVFSFATNERAHFCDKQVQSFVMPEIVIDLSAIFE